MLEFNTFLNIVLGVLMVVMSFILNNINEGIKTNTENILKHLSDLDAHCSRDKFKMHLRG